MAITFVRLFVMPAIGIGVVTAAEHFGFLPPGDKMFKFVLLLQHSMPSSILAGDLRVPLRCPFDVFVGNGPVRRVV